jgi:hypothetical protein
MRLRIFQVAIQNSKHIDPHWHSLLWWTNCPKQADDILLLQDKINAITAKRNRFESWVRKKPTLLHKGPGTLIRVNYELLMVGRVQNQDELDFLRSLFQKWTKISMPKTTVRSHTPYEDFKPTYNHAVLAAWWSMIPLIKGRRSKTTQKKWDNRTTSKRKNTDGKISGNAPA